MGSAIENAVFEATGVPLSFKEMFERVEADDEDAASRADILRTLHTLAWPARDRDGDTVFTTADLLERLNEIAERARKGAAEEPGLAGLRRFCTASRAAAPTPKAITRALRAIEGTPTVVGTVVMMLRAWNDSRLHTTTFKVVTLAIHK